jgi:uncharacterized membrane protein
MLVRISSTVLRVCALIALVLGVVFWTSSVGDVLVPIHMLLGILVVLSLWALGYAIATAPQGKSIGLAIGAFVLGLLVLFVGLTQGTDEMPKTLLYLSSSTHWIIQVVHLLLGISAIGIGEAIAGRYKRSNKVEQATTLQH